MKNAFTFIFGFAKENPLLLTIFIVLIIIIYPTESILLTKQKAKVISAISDTKHLQLYKPIIYFLIA